MQISEILNLIACGLGAVLGTGTKGCKPFFKKVTAIWLTPQGFEFDGNETLNTTYVKLLQAQGKLVVLKGIRTFTDNTPDDKIDELEDGTKSVATLALYEFAVKFISGMYFHAALHSLNSTGNFDALFVDREGNILGTKSATGNLKGFTLGMVQGGKLEWATDSTAQRESLMIQLLERTEFDTDFVFIQRNQLDFNANRIDGINEVVLSYTAVPSEAVGTSVTVKAVLKQSGQPVEGLAFGNFSLTKNGAANHPTADDDEATGAGIYVLTVPAFVTDDTLAVSLADVGNNRTVVEVSPDLFKSNTATATATA